MGIREALQRMTEVEVYQERPVERGLLEQILEVVRWTPSAANVQPWEVFVLGRREDRERLDGCLLDPFLREAAPGAAATPGGRVARAPVALVVAIERKRARARYGETGESFYAVQDTAAAVHGMRLAAAELGLGSDWIREVDLPRVAVALGLPALLRPVALLTLGWPGRGGEAFPGMGPEQWVHFVGEN